MKYPERSELRFQWGKSSFAFGEGSLAHLVADLNERGIHEGKIHLLGGKNSLEKSGVLRGIKTVIGSSSRFTLAVQDGIPPFPTSASCAAVGKAIAASSPQVIIAAGGGSVLDTVKIARFQSGSKACLVAIPTTAGTGSEVTPFATVWDFEKNEKRSIQSDALIPSLVYVDPVFTSSMPQSLTVSTAVDSLSHALESLWSKKATPESRELAFESLCLTLPILADLSNLKPSLETRRRQSFAALLSGRAIELSQTAAAHALSYGFTLNHEVPHGLAVGLVLPQVLLHNWSALPADTKERILKAFGGDGCEELAEGLRDFCGIAIRAEQLNLEGIDIDRIIQAGIENPRMSNNVLPVTSGDARKIIEDAVSLCMRHSTGET